jgi:cyclophilin family peptidyl-prolyl cis-trans isomerase
MKKHGRRRRHQPARRVSSAPAPSLPASTAPRRSWERIGWVVAGVAVLALTATLVYRFWPSTPPDELITQRPHTPPAEVSPPTKSESDSFLDAFNEKEAGSEKDSETPALSNAELEKRFAALAAIEEQVAALKAQKRDFAATERLQADFDRDAKLLERELAQAKRSRPQDAVPRWLTGELLMLVGGEPEEILPHFEFAVKQGLRRPRLLASIAREHLEANRFAEAYRAVESALDHAAQDRYVWKNYGRIAFCSNRFEEVRDKLGRAFPGDPPDWVRAIRKNARDLQDNWEVELKRREAETRANDLPRVKLTIEHRRFARDADGKPLTAIESTGREEAVLELFENEAPATVANFIDLVSRGVYDGTRFHLAVPAVIVAGGDPMARGSDASEDGTGGVGYVIPDEFQRAGARKHFRGSISMANTGPHTASSQFFICLSPEPAADGRHAVFGRVIEGQQAVDRITRGRTTRNVGFGRLIPGDVLVRAEVLRKRDHEYRAQKE